MIKNLNYNHLPLYSLFLNNNYFFPTPNNNFIILNIDQSKDAQHINSNLLFSFYIIQVDINLLLLEIHLSLHIISIKFTSFKPKSMIYNFLDLYYITIRFPVYLILAYVSCFFFCFSGSGILSGSLVLALALVLIWLWYWFWLWFWLYWPWLWYWFWLWFWLWYYIWLWYW